MPLNISLQEIWQRVTSTRHSRALEAEIARQRDEANALCNELSRLRAENRALLNSILGIAGIPPLPSSVSLPTKCHSESAAADDESRSTPSHPSSTVAEKNSPGTESLRNDIPPNPSPESSSLRFSELSSAHSPAAPAPSSSSPHSPRRQLAAPLRRRSWHQIMRTLELESGKKQATSD